MMKKFIIVLAVLVALPSFAMAANDVTFPQTSYFTLSDGLTYTIDTASTFDSFTVNTANVQFTASANSIISLASPDRKDFSYTGNNATYMTITENCENYQSTLLIVVAAGATETYTVTVTPSGSCASSGGTTPGGGTTGGGGGGGGGAPDTGAEGATTTSPADSQSSGGGEVTLADPVTASVSSEGGEASLGDNSVSLSLASGAVSADASVTITPQANYAQPSAGYAAVASQVYNITAQAVSGGAITQLGSASELTFNYTDAQIANFDESTLVASYWNEETGEWTDLSTTVDAVNNIATATVEHLTKFILQGKTTTAPPGSLIKTSASTAVYYLGHDGKRYTFPDDKVYYTWYNDFNDVITVSIAQMISFTLGGNVTVRQGTKLVQFVTYDYNGNMIVDDPHIYAVKPGEAIHWIETAETAASLYGSNWEQKINPVPNYLFGNYAVGDSISEATYPTGSVVKETSSNNLYYINGSQKRLITANGLVSNGFQTQYYLSAASLDSYTAGESLNDYQNSISWTSGK
ncbi:hypothetical protein KJ840_04010 [Patescibacteria group bacterium]|nr:hypothetical protein [Patescibacteria group bacterium]